VVVKLEQRLLVDSISKAKEELLLKRFIKLHALTVVIVNKQQ